MNQGSQECTKHDPTYQISMNRLNNLMHFCCRLQASPLQSKVVSLLPVFLPQIHNCHFHLCVGLVTDIRIQLWFCLPPVPELDKLVQQLHEFSLGMDNTMANLISCGRARF